MERAMLHETTRYVEPTHTGWSHIWSLDTSSTRCKRMEGTDFNVSFEKKGKQQHSEEKWWSFAASFRIEEWNCTH